MNNNTDILTRIQEKAKQEIDEKIGIYSEKCLQEYQIQLSEVVNQIKSSIFESHKVILNNDIEYLGLYPINKEDVIYCEVTGKPLQHKEVVFYKEGYGYIASEEVDQRDIDEGNVFYTSIGYEDVERKALRPIKYIEEKKIEHEEI
ncbi:hypothetical protein OCF64_28945 [Bacillus wiedmannii]|uniref:hypothetical protein n=1 Tax=Bacillus wiedmannii TaxID=1890302 RepID=UPI0021D07062|nr:hypothetical protein [Bacillus wiedmannii]MCU5685727.1 hypothetical protein [Bacillus wiedmannii]